jgi:hypothetical protein
MPTSQAIGTTNWKDFGCTSFKTFKSFKKIHDQNLKNQKSLARGT